MSDSVEALNRRAVERAVESWNRGDLDEYLTIYADDVVISGYVGLEPGIESVRRFYEAWFRAFPASQLLLKDVVAEGDRVACRIVVEGTHRGVFNGIPPSGKPVSVAAFTILRMAEGRCVERWSLIDSVALLTQIGALRSA